jgi:hypothetical protein
MVNGRSRGKPKETAVCFLKRKMKLVPLKYVRLYLLVRLRINHIHEKLQ